MSIFRKRRELYRFIAGNTVVAYTDASRDIDFNGDLYKREIIGREKIALTGEINQTSLKIKLKADNPIAQLFTVGTPEEVVTVTLFRESKTTRGEFHRVFSGRVASKKYKRGHKSTMICESLIASTQTKGLRRRYSKTCTYRLYSPQCGAQDITIQRRIAAIEGLNITLAGAPLSSDYAGGTVATNTGSARSIGSQNLNVITVVSPIKASVGEPLIISKGCDHSINTCKSRFSNQLNFGGQPFMPDDNPFTGDIL